MSPYLHYVNALQITKQQHAELVQAAERRRLVQAARGVRRRSRVWQRVGAALHPSTGGVSPEGAPTPLLG